VFVYRLGPVGPTGKDGKAGAVGKRGDAGVRGEQGPVGSDGKDGVNGKDGINGVDGHDGKEGVAGHVGPRGEAGPRGPAGTFFFVNFGESHLTTFKALLDVKGPLDHRDLPVCLDRKEKTERVDLLVLQVLLALKAKLVRFSSSYRC